MIDEVPNPASFDDEPEPTTATPVSKKPFVEPEISVPIDVLEATTFFQSVDSGTTN